MIAFQRRNLLLASMHFSTRFTVSFGMSLCRMNSPTFYLRRRNSFSLYAPWSGGFVRRLSSTPDRKCSCHSSSSATVRQCFRAAAWAGISPRKIFETSAERGFAVERLACFADVISHLHLAYSRMASGWVGFHGKHVVRLRWL